jgi:hypothetical protein
VLEIPISGDLVPEAPTSRVSIFLQKKIFRTDGGLIGNCLFPGIRRKKMQIPVYYHFSNKKGFRI